MLLPNTIKKSIKHEKEYQYVAFVKESCTASEYKKINGREILYKIIIKIIEVI